MADIYEINLMYHIELSEQKKITKFLFLHNNWVLKFAALIQSKQIYFS